ncbi:hypothetical protein HNQ80_001854 [Anaerosolibacter carboniphilus]|uniref:Uncharacterized protein n=1 Tax=Anaerosolibacter carboniphilus TaxID=1417629 RepID=A0A841L055_9FIRM|nr:hypothetical protein [Anaerosolibacter carboniphilus]MBB6215765.1 hypothetical protein [Anaerosolibacter carboniphilus]
MYNVAVNLLNATKDHSSITISDDKKTLNISEIQEKEMTAMNFWGQGAYTDDLNFFQSDFYAFLKIAK